MPKKSERFEMRLTQQELDALEVLSKELGVSKSSYLAELIKRAAKRKGRWDGYCNV